MLSAFADGALFGERHGTAPLAVLALHGWGRTHRDFDAALDAGFDAVALDLPGFGASPAPDAPMTSMDFARAVAPVLDEASAPVILVGHSHGGRVSVCLASLHPEKVAGLVLIGAPVLRGAPAGSPPMALRALKVLRRLGLVSEERLEAYRRSHGSADYRAAEGVQRTTLVRVINESFDAELRALRCPVVLLWGEEDHDVPVEVAERAAELIGTSAPPTERPRVSLITLPGIGHLVPTAAPGAVRVAIEQVAS